LADRLYLANPGAFPTRGIIVATGTDPKKTV